MSSVTFPNPATNPFRRKIEHIKSEEDMIEHFKTGLDDECVEAFWEESPPPTPQDCRMVRMMYLFFIIGCYLRETLLGPTGVHAILRDFLHKTRAFRNLEEDDKELVDKLAVMFSCTGLGYDFAQWETELQSPLISYSSPDAMIQDVSQLEDELFRTEIVHQRGCHGRLRGAVRYVMGLRDDMGVDVEAERRAEVKAGRRAKRRLFGPGKDETIEYEVRKRYLKLNTSTKKWPEIEHSAEQGRTDIQSFVDAFRAGCEFVGNTWNFRAIVSLPPAPDG